MKTASLQYTGTTVNNSLSVSYQSEINTLNNIVNKIASYTMKKLTNVSPFILLLIPVFVMMIFALTGPANMTRGSEITAKAAPANEIAKITAYQGR
ncbi:putative PurR-regulated permease PerM [Pedobacter cryoconitis]|uniref:Putative PurR-regulated permease PerM n=1 Tax=Pedobacter cryoconitis TaxID=188932 RepID=A0A7W9DII9_9SPHI|nr:hypothetical protein [Pedobacter cryoconitis]MBB5620183.1 putative PurR-regulated permease PerM [Pedobacter cryoconitis]